MGSYKVTEEELVDYIMTALYNKNIVGNKNTDILFSVKSTLSSNNDLDKFYMFREVLEQTCIEPIARGRRSCRESVLKLLKPTLFYVYKLFDKDNNLVYVGKSVSMGRRLKNHLGEKEFEYAKYLPCDNLDICDAVENHLILKYQPIYNLMVSLRFARLFEYHMLGEFLLEKDLLVDMVHALPYNKNEVFTKRGDYLFAQGLYIKNRKGIIPHWI